jgi:hypothetical protein
MISKFDAESILEGSELLDELRPDGLGAEFDAAFT